MAYQNKMSGAQWNHGNISRTINTTEFHASRLVNVIKIFILKTKVQLGRHILLNITLLSPSTSWKKNRLNELYMHFFRVWCTLSLRSLRPNLWSVFTRLHFKGFVPSKEASNKFRSWPKRGPLKMFRENCDRGEGEGGVVQLKCLHTHFQLAALLSWAKIPPGCIFIYTFTQLW